MPSRTLTTGALVALALLARPRSGAAQITEHRLANGLLLLIDHPRDGRSEALSLGVFVGHVDDTLRGAAHLMEHVAMREGRDGRSMSARYQLLGFTGGAYTQNNVTMFGISGRAGPHTLDSLLDITRIRLSDLAISPTGLESERRSVGIEVARGAYDPWQATLVANHQLHAGESHADLAHISRDALFAFYRKYYTPSNAAVIITSPLPDSTIIARATTLLGSLPAGSILPRPPFRDSSTIAIAAWTGVAASDRLLALNVPGPQHAAAPLLEVALAKLASAPGTSGVSTSLKSATPITALVFTTRDTANAAERLLAQRDALIALVQSAGLDTLTRARLDASSLLECEAAGSWRYCLPSPVDAPRQSAVLTQFLRATIGSAGAVVMWPSVARALPTPARAAEPITAATKSWRAPDPGPVRFQRSRGGLEWAARTGGHPDSAYILAVLAPTDPAPSHAAIVAIELFTRSWHNLRLPDGRKVDSAFAAEGIAAAVRSLPYPVLATGDAFTTIGVPATPLGVYGIEVTITAAPAKMPRALALLHEVLASGTIDPGPFAALHEKQLELLRASVAGVSGAPAAVRRGRLLASMNARFAPQSPADQLVTMQQATLEGMLKAVHDVASSGIGRITMLGVTAGEAQHAINASGFARLGALHWRAAPPACRTTDTLTTSVPVATTSASVDLYAFSCWASDTTALQQAAVTLANTVIGGIGDALLAHRLRDELGVAYAFESRILSAWDSRVAIWSLKIFTQSALLDSTVREIRATLGRAVTEGPPASLIEAGRTVQLNRWQIASENPVSWITTMLWRGRTPDDELAAMKQVTAGQVRAVLVAGWSPEGVGVVH